MLKTYLFLRGGPKVIVINAPWYLTDNDEDAVPTLSDSARSVPVGAGDAAGAMVDPAGSS